MISTEKGVVGEFDAQIEMDLGTFGRSEVPNDPVEEITEKISSKPFLNPVHSQAYISTVLSPNKNTDLNKKSMTPEKPEILKENQHATRAVAGPLQSKQENPKNPSRPVTRKSLRDAQADKENIQAKAEKPVKEVASIKLDSAINCAMDMIMASHAKQTPTCSGTPPRPDSLEKTEAEERTTTTPVYSEATVTPELPKNEAKTSGSDLAKPTAASLNKQKQTVLGGPGAAGMNPSIVKKTLAKMTAAFKPNRPVVVLDREALKGKRMNFSGKKAATVSTAEARSGRANTPSGRGTPGRLNSSRDFT